MGHVLDKVDEESQDLELKTIIKSEWSGLQLTKPEPEIFWKFIDKERKLILKEYLIRAGQGVTINLGLGKEDGSFCQYHYKINSGYYEERE